MSVKSDQITPIHFIPKACSQCGIPLEERFIEEEGRNRLFCASCGRITYLNPLIVAGTVPIRDGKILLLRRGIEPAKGAWTFPAGFVELWETVPGAAVRETKEEVGVDVKAGELLNVYSYSDAGVVVVVYHAEVIGGTMTTSREAMEVREFLREEIPWSELAFRSTTDALKDWARSASRGAVRFVTLCATLCYVRKSRKTLMLHRIKKKNDIHEGKWNGLGGKMEPGESPEDCVLREVREESGLRIRNPELRAILTFPRFDGKNDWIVFVFTARRFSGRIVDSREGVLKWIPDAQVTRLPLWEGDKLFLKWLKGRAFFSAKFVYRNGKLKDHRVWFHPAKR